jgi:hypothetical protein
MRAFPRLTLVAILPCLLPAAARGDAFDRYINPILSAAPMAEGVQPINKLTPELIGKHNNLFPNSSSCLVIVKTASGRNAKLLVQSARQKAGDSNVSIALLERFVTYREGTERALLASGQNVQLYDGFQFNLEIGQVTPKDVGGDVRFVANDSDGYLEPVGKAKMYLVTKALPGTEPKKGERPTAGDPFSNKFFNGTFKLSDDGRRSGVLTLKVDDEGNVTGSYTSDATGGKYDVVGKVPGTPKNQIQFTVIFPQTRQNFTGLIFTRDGAAICGTTVMQGRESAFYAIRTDE